MKFGDKLVHYESAVWAIGAIGLWDICIALDPPWYVRTVTAIAFFIGMAQWVIRIREAHMRETWEKPK